MCHASRTLDHLKMAKRFTCYRIAYFISKGVDLKTLPYPNLIVCPCIYDYCVGIDDFGDLNCHG